MQKGPNLGKFLNLVKSKLPDASKMPTVQLEEAEIYLEFTYPRDSWELLGKNNEGKRRSIFESLSRVPQLGHYKSEDFPRAIPEFNEYFMGLGERR